MTARQRLLQAIKGDPSLVERLLVVAEPNMDDPIRDDFDAYRAVAPLCHGMATEVLVAVALDRRLRVINAEILTRGCDRYCIVDPKQILRWALLQGRSGASGIILAHNHPTGDPTPSQQDIEVTRRVVMAGRAVGIPLSDHIIVGDGDRYTSMMSDGHMMV